MHLREPEIKKAYEKVIKNIFPITLVVGAIIAGIVLINWASKKYEEHQSLTIQKQRTNVTSSALSASLPRCHGTITVIAPPYGAILKDEEVIGYHESKISPSVRIPDGCDFGTRHNGPVTMIAGNGKIYTDKMATERSHLGEFRVVRFASEYDRAVTIHVDFLPYGTLQR